MTTSPDFAAALNDGERDVLRLLASGHTIKSAAHLLDITENAASERLRSARRKTGASSSRDLARQLYGQISCDGFSGVPQSPVNADHPREDQPSLAGRTKKRIALMTVIGLAIAATTLAVTQLPGDAAPARSPFETELAGSAEDWRTRLENEREGGARALEIQQQLGTRFSRREGIGLVFTRCRATLCQITAQVAKEDRSQAIGSVSKKDFVEELARSGLGEVRAIDLRFVASEEGPGTITVFTERTGT